MPFTASFENEGIHEPYPRNAETFRRIEDYPYAESRQGEKRGERVVELAADYAVPNIRRQ
jgi:hypothetical protein